MLMVYGVLLMVMMAAGLCLVASGMVTGNRPAIIIGSCLFAGASWLMAIH